MNYLLVASALFLMPGIAFSEAWNLPSRIDDHNCTVRFEVDTTWHTVKGTASGIEGLASLQDKRDAKSVQLEVTIPVQKLDTGSKSRDREMRKDMSSDEYPEIKVIVPPPAQFCDFVTVTPDHPCTFTASGFLTIKNVTKEVPLKCEISVDPTRDYRIRGTAEFDWPDFGIEDPSIFLAKVHPETRVTFQLNLPKTQGSK